MMKDFDTAVVVVSVVLLLFVWVPALIWAVRKAGKREPLDDEQ
jgi:hypothetical protein